MQENNVDMAERETSDAADVWPPERIKSLRKNLGMTQKDFAKRVGVHVVTVIRWEGGGFKPSGLALQNLEQLSKSCDSRS